MDDISQQHDRIDQLVQNMISDPEHLTDNQIRRIAGILLDLNAYARHLDAELTKAYIVIGGLRTQKFDHPIRFSVN